MERNDALELLNSTHDFPCAFTIKVIGVAADNFTTRVVEVVEEALRAEGVPHRTRETPNGKHTSITLEPTIQTAEQVLLLYERIKSIEGVVMTM